jgi:hemoglobin
MTQEHSTTAPSLYDRLGKRAGIDGIVRDVIAAHLANPLVKTRYEGVKDFDRLHRVSVEFFCAGSGGPEPYTGRDMISSHKGMNISEQEYLAVVDDIMTTLEKHAIDAQTRSDVVGILYSLKPQVLRL